MTCLCACWDCPPPLSLLLLGMLISLVKICVWWLFGLIRYFSAWAWDRRLQVPGWEVMFVEEDSSGSNSAVRCLVEKKKETTEKESGVILHSTRCLFNGEGIAFLSICLHP